MTSEEKGSRLFPQNSFAFPAADNQTLRLCESFTANTSDDRSARASQGATVRNLSAEAIRKGSYEGGKTRWKSLVQRFDF